MVYGLRIRRADELETITKELPSMFEYTLLRERIIELETKLQGTGES